MLASPRRVGEMRRGALRCRRSFLAVRAASGPRPRRPAARARRSCRADRTTGCAYAAVQTHTGPRAPSRYAEDGVLKRPCTGPSATDAGCMRQTRHGLVGREARVRGDHDEHRAPGLGTGAAAVLWPCWPVGDSVTTAAAALAAGRQRARGDPAHGAPAAGRDGDRAEEAARARPRAGAASAPPRLRRNRGSRRTGAGAGRAAPTRTGTEPRRAGAKSLHANGRNVQVSREVGRQPSARLLVTRLGDLDPGFVRTSCEPGRSPTRCTTRIKPQDEQEDRRPGRLGALVGRGPAHPPGAEERRALARGSRCRGAARGRPSRSSRASATAPATYRPIATDRPRLLPGSEPEEHRHDDRRAEDRAEDQREAASSLDEHEATH